MSGLASTTLNNKTNKRNNLEIIFSICNNEGLELWDIHTGINIKTILAPIDQLCILDNNTFVFSQSDKPALQIWSWINGNSLIKCTAPEKVTCFITTGDHLYLLAGSITGKIYIWDIQNGALLRVVDAHFKKVSVLAFSSDNYILYTGGDDGILNSWIFSSLLDTSINNLSRTSFISQTCNKAYIQFSGHSLPITGINVGLNNIVTCSLDHTIRVWNIKSNVEICKFVLTSALTNVVFDPCESFIIASSIDGTIFKIDLTKENLSNNSETTEISKPTIFAKLSKTVSYLALNFDASLLITASVEGCLVWDIVSGQVVKTLKKLKNPCTQVVVLQDLNGFFGNTENPTSYVAPALPKKFLAKDEDRAIYTFKGTENGTKSKKMCVDDLRAFTSVVSKQAEVVEEESFISF